MNYPNFLVRIDCMTYNHAPFITDTMNGFCMQQTTFPFVATIIDDASTDGEPDVIRQYINEHFDTTDEQVYRQWETEEAWFIFARHKENRHCFFAVVFLKQNYYQLRKPKGPLIKEWTETKYVALCEGDDFWTDSGKLEMQVGFLERNSVYSLCAHAVNYIKNGELLKVDQISDSECELSLPDLITNGGDFLSTCSLVLRSENNKNIPFFRKKAKVGDYSLVLHMGLMGKVHYFPNVLSNYRYMSAGSWTQRNHGEKMYEYFLNEVEWLGEFNKETKYKFDAEVNYRIMAFARTLMYRRIIDADTFKSYLKFINIFKLKKDCRDDYFWQMLTYRYNGLYNFACKIKNILNKIFFIS